MMKKVKKFDFGVPKEPLLIAKKKMHICSDRVVLGRDFYPRLLNCKAVFCICAFVQERPFFDKIYGFNNGVANILLCVHKCAIGILGGVVEYGQ
jgi:hypothetical protein